MRISRVHIGQQDAERAASDPAEDVVGAQQPLQEPRKGDEHAVASAMSVLQVDRPEVIEIEQGDVSASAAVDEVTEHSNERFAVGQAGEGVCHRRNEQPIFERTPILDQGEPAEHPRFGPTGQIGVVVIDGTIVDGDNGYLFPPDDADALAERLRRILNADQQELNRLSENSLHLIQSHDIERTIKIFEDLYIGIRNDGSTTDDNSPSYMEPIGKLNEAISSRLESWRHSAVELGKKAEDISQDAIEKLSEVSEEVKDQLTDLKDEIKEQLSEAAKRIKRKRK